MTRYLSVNDIITLYERVMAQSGGLMGIRELAVLESAVLQARQTFDGNDLYPSLLEKASALCYGLIQNHPFLDGNKRIGHAAMEVFLLLNGIEIDADIDEQERLILGIASGTVTREQLQQWLISRTKTRTNR
jgi:death-on-curing protein